MADLTPPGPNPDDPYAYRPRSRPAPGSHPPEQQWQSWQQPIDPGPKRRSMWIPAGVGFLLTVALAALSIASVFGTDTGVSAALGETSLICLLILVVVSLVMVFPAKSRVWGGGLLIGTSLAIGISLVVFAGACTVLIFGMDGSS